MLGLSPLGERAMGAGNLYDEVAFQMWLRSTDQAVDFVAYVYYHGDSAVYGAYNPYVLTLSSWGFVGSRGRIKSLPKFKREISADLNGPVQYSFGELVIENGDGGVDSWHNLSVDGQYVRIYYGNRDWGVSRFRLMMECICDGPARADETSITFNLRAIDFRADQPIQIRTVASNTAANAPSNTLIPITLGQVFNVAPPCIDEVNQIYQAHDAALWGSLTSISQVRSNGVPFQTQSVAISAVDTATEVITTASNHGYFQNTLVRCPIGSMPDPGTGFWYAMAWNGTVFVAITYDAGASGKFATSPDGLTWTERTAPASNGGRWNNVVWNGRVFCAIENSSTYTATSPDGITWTSAAGRLPSSAVWSGIAWNGTVFCAIASGTVAATSPDGVTWTARTLPASVGWSDICWNGTVFCAIANNTTTAATSPDGITWTARTMPSAIGWTALAWSGLVYCAIADQNGVGGATNVCATSPDGITWTSRTLSASTFWGAIAWNGSVFCAITNASTTVASTSPDGITWTTRTLPSAVGWTAIAWNGYVFCALGDLFKRVTVSTDGITWSGVSNSLPTGLSANTNYWATPLSATTFTLSATRGGTPVNLTSATTGAVLVGYHWEAELSTGKVYCDSKPDVLTLDCVGPYTLASTAVPAALGITSNVDELSRTNFATLCAQTQGIYIAERRNRREVADDLMRGIGAWYGFNRHNLLQFGRIEASYTTYDHLLGDDMMLEPLVIEDIIPPRKQHRLGYRKNWTDQSSGLAAGVSTEGRGLYSTPHSVTPVSYGADESPTGTTGFHLLAEKPDVIETMMAYGSDAKTEADRRNTLFYGNGAIFSCKARRVGWVMDPGDKVKVVYPRYGLTSGVIMSLIQVEDLPDEGACQLKFLYAAMPAYVPGQL